MKLISGLLNHEVILIKNEKLHNCVVNFSTDCNLKAPGGQEFYFWKIVLETVKLMELHLYTLNLSLFQLIY